MQAYVSKVSEKLRAKGYMLATAESCTGGMIGAAMTELSGSSDIYAGGFVTYSNDLKIKLLGVSEVTLKNHGAVSSETASEMAAGALEKTGADIAVSVTGIAGPGGGSTEKPVGLVYIGIALKNSAPQTFKHNFDGDRASIRQQTVETALSLTLKKLETS